MNRFIKALLKILAGVPVLAVCFFVASDVVSAKAETLTITAALPGNIDGQGRRFYKFNQLVQNGNFTSTSIWWTGLGGFTVNNNKATITANNNNFCYIRQSIQLTTGHKYFLTYEYLAASGSITLLTTINGAWSQAAGTGTWCQVNNFFTASVSSFNLDLGLWQNQNGNSAQFRKVNCVDLTLMWGNGFEPTTRDMLYPFFTNVYSTREGVVDVYDYQPNYLSLPLDPRFSWAEATREGAEYDAGYTDAIQYAYNNLYDITLGGVRYIYSNSQPYSAGYSANPGYQQGVTDATNLYSGSLIGNIFSSIGNLLSIQLLPGLSIGVICAVPVVLGLLLFIIKIIRK